jgi:protein ImuB
MLWMGLWFEHLPIELRQPRDANRCAITDRIGPHRIVIAANAQARLGGIQAGMQATAALLQEPELRLIERTKSEERRAFRALADWSLQFSSLICLDLARWLLWIEIGASLRYFEGLPTLKARIDAGIAALGYTPSVGIAPTLEGAALFARVPGTLAAHRIADIGALAGGLPLTHLAFEPKIVMQLQSAGLVTIADVLAIPPSALARRFGPSATDYLQRLLGTKPDPGRRHSATQTYRRRIDFADAIQTLEGLLFPLRRMLQECEGYLRGRDVAIQRLHLTLRHRDEPDTAFALQTTAPLRDAPRLFALLREKLERTAWKAAVTEVVISADEFLAPEILQGDFFDDTQRRSAGWSALLDKLRARLGETAVRRLGLRDDHRPEEAWCIQSDVRAGALVQGLPDRPLWLLPPTPIERPPHVVGTPERIEAGWWAGQDVARDYYIAVSPEGSRLWLFREANSERWFLHGLWA